MRTTVQNIGKTKQHKTREDAPPGLGEDISQHFPLVWSIARSFAREKRERHRDDSDAFGEGLLHLLKALETYDETRGAKLETWITINVRSGINAWSKLSATRLCENIDSELEIESRCEESSLLHDLERIPSLVELFDQSKLRSILSQRIEGRTWKEIGDTLHCSKQAVEQLFNRQIMPVLRGQFLA